jgi:Thaumatin family
MIFVTPGRRSRRLTVLVACGAAAALVAACAAPGGTAAAPSPAAPAAAAARSASPAPATTRSRPAGAPMRAAAAPARAPRSVCNPARWPVDYAAVFKRAEPYAYSYVDDDATSVFTCQGQCDYQIVFGLTPRRR